MRTPLVFSTSLCPLGCRPNANPKFEARNIQSHATLKGLTKQIRMTEIKNIKTYDLEERTFEFAKRCRLLVKNLTKSVGNIEDGKQLIKASRSVGANYIEANEAFSKKDFIMRIKISRKEAKESRYWLRLIDMSNDQELEAERLALIQESTELMNIFGSIVRKGEKV